MVERVKEERFVMVLLLLCTLFTSKVEVRRFVLCGNNEGVGSFVGILSCFAEVFLSERHLLEADEETFSYNNLPWLSRAQLPWQ